VFTRALHWSLSRARLIQSLTSHPTSLRSILILSSHLRLVLYSSLFPSGLPTKILYEFPSPHACYVPCQSHPPWLDHSNYLAKSTSFRNSSLRNFHHHSTVLSPSGPNILPTTCRHSWYSDLGLGTAEFLDLSIVWYSKDHNVAVSILRLKDGRCLFCCIC
jgi:hypothetical protein